MSRWFRHYAGMVRDDKLVRASIKSKQSIERVVWIWGAVLESAAELDDGGRYEVDTDEIARFLRCKPAAIQAVLNALTDLGRVDGETITAWGVRQFKSDKSNARVAEHRAKKRITGNTDVTLQQRDRIAPETETETDSVANATAVDPEKVMFDSGVQILTASGKSPSAARTLLGKWKRDHSPAEVIEALGAAQRNGIIDPASWIEGRWRKRTNADAWVSPA